jgi:hypothetical protein
MTNKVDVIRRMISFQRDNGNSLLADILETELNEEIERTPVCWWNCGEEEVVKEVI